MLLSKLEIRGFKSFGDRVTINFDEGITGVVGPNGSGKSNVVDAIRWVLGEQSTKALRSEKMDNIIFNGTKKRKPLQMAEVAMTFKNTRNLLPTEYSEVTIARRYYRSGEGEYLLNGVTCRLKDIQNLFLDTGIGSDSYAIIELKMVDEILNDQNNSRRALFEEAAGISKFKKRKKETFKKLEETDADLERVEDLLHEISKNLKSLERQAKQAEKYLKIKAEYKIMSIALAQKSIASQLDKIESLQKQIDRESDVKVQTTNQLAQLEADLEKQKASLIQKEKLLASRQKTYNEHVHKIRQFESDKKIKNERLKFLNDKCNTLQQRIEEDTQSNNRAKFSLESLTKEQESVEKILHETQYYLEKLQSEYEGQKNKTNQLKAEVNELSSQVKNKQNLVYQLRKSLEINEVQCNSLKQELERESTETVGKTEDLANFSQKIEGLENELEDKRNRLELLQGKEEELETQIVTTEQSLSSLREQLNKNNRKLDSRQHEYNLTKSMVENLEGYPEAIRFLKKNVKWGKNAPLLSDIITTEEKYRITIENFLAPYLNYYVVETEAQALNAVHLLSNATKGKANFLILEKLNSYQPSISLRQFENTIPAINIVEYDEKYRFLVNFLLENVYIIVAQQHQLPTDDSAIFITQDGKVIKQRFTIAGGSVGLFEGKKLGRAKNLEKFAKEISSLERTIGDLESMISQKQNDIEGFRGSSAKAEIALLQNQINLLNEEYITVKTKKEQFTNLLADSADKRETILEKISQLTEAIDSTRPQLLEEVEGMDILESRLEELNENLVEETELSSEKSSAFNQQNILFHQQNNRLDSLNKEIGYKQNAFDVGKARIENNITDLKHTEQEIKQLEDASDEGEQQLIDLYEEKDSIGEGVKEAEKEYYDTRGNISEAEKSIRELQRKKENSDQILMELQNRSNQTKMEINSVKERVSVEFETDVTQPQAESERYQEFSEDFLREEVSKTKDKLSKMGAINHTAIEAYQEIKERHDFIESQRNDLAEAKASLLKTIEEIDNIAKQNFLASFEQIRENFVEVFRSLFTAEDNCDLTLQSPDDPLGSKIEIIARPKGKRPSTINQLSGGEKTLTATALLFAIYLLKPAPFCIFDEVDAPLDDANIDKFNNIIRKFSDNSQFIIVTHNKRTMVSTDVIYGITMIESITTVVPVSLKEIPDHNS